VVNSVSDKAYLNIYLCKFMLVSCRIVIELKCFSQVFRKNENTNFLLSNFSPEILAVCEKAWKSIVDPDRPQMTILNGACALGDG
jgi:hypothetical protein